MIEKSRLQIPRPSARPGDEPDFSYLELSPAGAVDKPAIGARTRDIENLSSELVRVLDDDHEAKGPWDPNLDPEQLQVALRWMMLNRVFDDRMWQIQRQGRISFYMQARGEEAISIAQGMALRAGDMCFPSYRNQGLYMYRGMKLVDMMCQCLSNTRDMCKGRQLPIMYHSKAGNVFSISGNLATQAPHAVGWAMASALKGEDHIAATWVGDGSTAEADFHHALTFAAVYQAPVIINVVNNQWAISTFQGTAGGQRRPFAARGLGLGIPGLRVDGNDFLAVYSATLWAADRARRGGGPTLIELVTYRGGAHSTSDDPSKYRPKDEWDAFPLGDPIERLKQHLITEGNWSDAKHAALEDQLRDEVMSAWKEAQKYGTMTEGPWLDPSTMFDDVYAEIPAHLESQRRRLLEILDGD
ncbi:MAG: 3-methyl-2-oxobutanoate dehydrogenase (2-methylpropanoyl-transferring) subunit alpha [Gammaproteobacteria bacterium]|jgi:2-oxoisovalerate dehydrogenase E1 component alpha subunit|nr:3-methyl-2-oxobutanoate dehydrogenase (2-methylpropanoyl-transferring) subunit alpha [Gammaproteobacteria bacterium]MDH3820114.1 3-methyl-2-oxobutanoate dehydrogenase (2-methylpropanoyl-transferring) subunit alpha [Gammaproteobacteria bacterium]MDH3905841.1 3-methyl-2-oxobutanoate dehydrogenase (2-methylpropanoyl-transferring) subunit alpha [Gammaproteobacteria bacterium]MDH3953427.1 3-methyl-2-oxobutanoate dehydrogenase (2-methylpropanoyl-transferring) subunit alpha [Gammaproteobacteria bact